MWIVPAKVAGTWKSAQGDLTLKQEYQTFNGTLGAAPLAEAKLSGDRISFSSNGTQYSGRVNGNTIEGSFKSSSGGGAWKATRS